MGRVVHFEIHADDTERAAKFYSQAFGWKIEKWKGPVDYWLVTTGAPDEQGIDGGLTKRQGPSGGEGFTSFVCTIDVDDVDSASNNVMALGGSIAAPKGAVPGVGWLAYAKDTEGNQFGMMQSDPDAK